jgi:hypothetical protein
MIRFLVLFILFNFNAQAAIDLGDLEIEGEVRRPMIQYISSEKGKRDAMYSFLEEEFDLTIGLMLRLPVAPNRAIRQKQKNRDQLLTELLD